CDDARGMAACLNELAAAATWVGNFADATTLSQQAIRFAERAHDETTIATALAQAVTSGADYEDVAERARRALLHLRRVGNLDQQARVCVNAGYAAIVERRYRDALAWLDDGLDPARRLDDAAWQFTLLGNLGLATLFIDEFDEARRQFSAALAICREAGCEDIVDETLLGLAAVEASCGRFPRAARLTGAAKRHEVPRGVAEDAVWSRLTEEILAPAREHDGHERWDSAEREGAELTVRDALDLALRRGRFAPATDATMTAARS
ncbi:MAG TPA: tetratricopeptide repeat protein, partial [Solirubrobacteraceae bacterium]|nr:tetratricopeptide repeat protein [Solirubrobacteraceae bacterium]